jgi:glycosyltransferase involved in cell wall biosynthesis
VPHERVLALLTEARVAVLPSFSEAFAIAPLEAMAAGCPTIGSALGSGPELLEHGVDGLTVNPKQTEEIEEALTRMLSDEAWAKQLAERGRRKIEDRFSIGHLVKANLAFYRECIVTYAAQSRRQQERLSANAGEGRPDAPAHVRGR